ncbi:MAG: ISL3 family transposase [Gammaproteobacteria bacterium CG11_big_fil_rev_8_21_14_0_20_46_22]|nr:MAG: ISL3 family transposase [Gammaproteobacteria bacterium CG12_big_fil_rev_8_21_14_0_65_46_12]PIR11942.1 MAG: ISL3 family transposase [Gammaproteobacteria bacterium CG11_big_fil_rev_8_21_14_0_20_46_22]
MPRSNSILNLPGFTVQKISGYSPVVFELSYRRKASCVHCSSRNLRKKDTFVRKVWHELMGVRRSLLQIKAYKFHCRSCGRYFNQQFPGIIKYQRATERLKKQLCEQHSQGISQKDLSRRFKLGKATIERWYHQWYWRANQEILDRDCPRVLGIDEHSFSRKRAKKQFATTLCDLRKHRVFDVVSGRSGADLGDYLCHLKGKERVKVICMDLSSSYKSIAQQHFPNAMIVADRFHVIRQLNQQCLQVYQKIDPGLKYHRGLLSALRTNPENLTPKKLKKRNDYFLKQPAVEAVYWFKQRLHQLLMYKHRTAKQCRRLIPLFLDYIQQLKASPFKALRTLGKTLYQWREEIVRMWRFTKSNGITEGFHRKMKLIQRRAYGFRNFDNYRLRVRVLCS